MNAVNIPVVSAEHAKIVVRVIHRGTRRAWGAVTVATPVARIATSGLIGAASHLDFEIKRIDATHLLCSQDWFNCLPLDVNGFFFLVKHFVRLSLFEHTFEFRHVLVVAVGRIVRPHRQLWHQCRLTIPIIRFSLIFINNNQIVNWIGTIIWN